MTPLSSRRALVRLTSLGLWVLLGLLLPGCESYFRHRGSWSQATSESFPEENRFAKAWKLPDGSYHLRFGAKLDPPTDTATKSPCGIGVEVRLHGYRNEPIASVLDDAPAMLVNYFHVPTAGAARCTITGSLEVNVTSVTLSNQRRVNEFDPNAGRALLEFSDVDIGARRMVGQLRVFPGALAENRELLNPMLEGPFAFSNIEFPQGPAPADVEENLP